MPFFLPYANLWKKRRAGHHTINSKQYITTSTNLSSHHTLIINISQQNKCWSILKSTQSSSCWRYHHIIIKRTKTTCKTCYPHALWQWIWTSHLSCLIHYLPTHSNWTQNSRPCDTLLPRWRIISTRFSPHIPCNQKWTSIDNRLNRTYQQPHRKIHHGTIKSERSPTLHDFLWTTL